jgi:hypothetical protein
MFIVNVYWIPLKVILQHFGILFDPSGPLLAPFFGLGRSTDLSGTNLKCPLSTLTSLKRAHRQGAKSWKTRLDGLMVKDMFKELEMHGVDIGLSRDIAFTGGDAPGRRSSTS